MQTRRKGTGMRIVTGWIRVVVALAVMAASGSARAVDFFDGRLQVHGAMAYENRVLSDGYRLESHNWFMSSMKTKLSVEIEAELFPDGVGPFDIVEAFARVDFSYNCIWDNACDPSSYFGDDVRRLPEYLSNGKTRGVTGVLPDPLNPRVREQPNRQLVTIADLDPFSTLLSLGAPEDIEATFGDNILKARFSSYYISGSLSPLTQGLGPFNPGYEIDSTGALAHKAIANQAALPFRPDNDGPCATATPLPGGTGCLFNPSSGLRRRIDEYDNPDVNFTVNELKWDLGASQQETKFLREAYVDITMLDGRLQMRLGKQITRWGKTELFRGGTPDQLNPQDFAISNLPGFEESLIPLWQARFIASFYEVGPLEDVRLEFVANLDTVQPNDLGDCGEPYTVFLVCAKEAGLLAHGFSGLGIAGERRAPKFWDSGDGLEFGLRLEFRVGRFSVAITDFYGYDDFPTPDWFQPYSRNVDPRTGRPTIVGTDGPCTDGTQPACLSEANVLLYHSGNRQLWDTTCKATQNFVVPGALGALLPLSACVIAVFNNPDDVLGTTVPAILAEQLANGDRCNAGGGFCIVFNGLLGKGSAPIEVTGVIPLHPGLNDLARVSNSNGLSGYLSPEQQALLGCGAYYGPTDCDREGFDLFNLEASVLFQAFPQTEHAARPLEGSIATRWIPGTGTIQLPGSRSVFTYFDDTVGFRWNPNVDGCVVGLSNLDTWSGTGLGTAIRNDLINEQGLTAAEADQCDDDPNPGGGFGYQVPVPDAMNPVGPLSYFDQTGTLLTVDEVREFFPTEMAIVSVNLFRLLVGLGTAIQEPAGVCTFADPGNCEFMNAFFETTAVQRPERRAGGNGNYGRRDMSWLSGAALDLFYERRNVLGLSLDFAEDRTKTTWGIDFTWIEDAPYINNRADNGYSKEDTLNLTMSIDRPTFINFLNANRTVFFNAQLFFRYIPDYKRRDTFDIDGPLSALMTLTAFTGFWQDRLMTFFTVVHEAESNSGGQIVTMSYRFSESFSATVGLSSFYGKPSRSRVLDISPATRFHTGDFTQRSNFRGLSAISQRDELFVSIRRTF